MRVALEEKLEQEEMVERLLLLLLRSPAPKDSAGAVQAVALPAAGARQAA